MIKRIDNLIKIFFNSSIFLILMSTNALANTKILNIGAIPDQNQEILDKRFNLLSKELSKKLKVNVNYFPVIDYLAAVTAFRTKDLDLVWFGGLSGVQARLQTPDSIVLAQRDIDKQFKSIFVVNKKHNLNKTKNIKDLRFLKGLRFTFGSENSTSGRLMPQYFLDLAGIKIQDFKGKKVGFSGSHDATIALINSGAYDAGALNKQIWDNNLKKNSSITKNVKVFFISPEYVDYHWLAQGDLDEKFSKGFSKKLKETILNLNLEDPNQRKILEMFNAKKFINADASQYKNIESIARKLKKIR